MNRRGNRLFDLASGLLLITGTLLFLNGGRQHPAINSSLGPPGSEEYFRNFAGHVVHHHDWEGIHSQILAGPILWILGAAALAERRRRSGESAWSGLGQTALLLGTAGWVVAFVFDGFVAPDIAGRLASSDGALAQAIISEFAANQMVVIRTGLVAWLLLALGAMAFSTSLVLERGAGIFQRLVGGLGIPIGLASFAAWIGGSFSPGPFVSPWWNSIAIATGLWFLLAGVVLAGREPPAGAEGRALDGEAGGGLGGEAVHRLEEDEAPLS
jgi:hypothetical protein